MHLPAVTTARQLAVRTEWRRRHARWSCSNSRAICATITHLCPYLWRESARPPAGTCGLSAAGARQRPCGQIFVRFSAWKVWRDGDREWAASWFCKAAQGRNASMQTLGKGAPSEEECRQESLRQGSTRADPVFFVLLLPIVPATPRGKYKGSRVKRCAWSAGRRCRRCARGQHERVGWHAKQAVQRRRRTALQGGDSAKTGKGAKAATQRAPQAQDPTNRNPKNLAPAARGLNKPAAGRCARCGARPIQCPR